MTDGKPPLGDTSGWALPERTNVPYDEPSALSLINAVQKYLSDELGPRSKGADRWTIRIAANALTIAAREVELGPSHRAAYEQRMTALGADGEADLSQQINGGSLDDRWPEVHAALLATVEDKLAVANPSYPTE